MRDMINKSLELISFFIVFILFFSCTGEIEDETGSKTAAGGKVQIALQIPITAGDATSFTTRSEVDNESTIRNLTLFFFDSSGTKKFATYIDLSNINGSSSDVDMNRWANEKVITILNANILSQLSESRNVHVVANYGDLSGTATEADLNAIITNPITADIPSPTPTGANPLVMHGADLNHVFATNSKSTVSLVRNIAKVQMTLTTTDFTLGGKKISLAPESTSPSALSSAKVINQADRSFLVSKGSNPSRALTPPNITYFNGANTTVAVSSRTTSGTTTFVPHINYINENLRESYSVETNVTALILQIPYQVNGGEININNYYKILINNVDGNDKYKINRNTIYDITASISTLGGETDASAVLVKGTLNVLPWDENLLTSDLTQTFLSVEKSAVQIGVNGTLTYSTNALFSSDPQLSECSVITTGTPSWLTVSLVSATQIDLKASTMDYTAPRTGTFKLKIRNLIKEITVTQASSPTTGSIKLQQRGPIYLWKDAPLYKREVGLEIVNNTYPPSPWLMTEGDRAVATCDPDRGEGAYWYKLTFTSGTSYGGTQFKFTNLNTMEYDSIQVYNLHLEVPSVIDDIDGKGGISRYTNLKAYGGNAEWDVKSCDWWLTAKNENGTLVINANKGNDGQQERNGFITICHVNDRDYTKTIQVKQGVYFVIYDFDYLVLKYNWSGTSGKDLDTATEFISTGLQYVDNRALGYHMYGDVEWNGSSATNGKSINKNTTGGSGLVGSTGNPTKDSGATLTDPSGRTILVWGGDNTNLNAGESLYVDVQNLLKNNLPDSIYIDLYAIWWSDPSSNPIKVEVTAYKNGTMKRYDDSYSSTLQRNFYNVDGSTVYSNTDTKLIRINQQKVYYQYRSKYVKVGRVTFYKEKRKAKIRIEPDINSSSTSLAKDTRLSVSSQFEGRVEK